MKISYRILIAALAVVVLSFASSTLTFYSFTGKIALGLAGVALSLVFVLLRLNKNSRAKAEYTAFVALINQNLSLGDMSDAVLAKIIKSTGLTAGRLYMTDNTGEKLLASCGLLNETSLAENSIDLHKRVIEKGEEAEYFFTENFPVIRSGLTELKVRYLLIYPVIYNQNVIAVLEAASVGSPGRHLKPYLSNIKDQLAAGLSKAYELRKLENLVQELKVHKEEQRVAPPSVQENITAKETDKLNENPEHEPAYFTDEELFSPEQLPVKPEVRESINYEALQEEIEKRASHTILIIDANPENRKIISRYLTSKHYSVLQSESIQQGMKEISLQKPFAVALAVSSSDLTSWDALKQLKDSTQTRSIPVVLYNTVDALNFGCGLQLYDYIFGPLNAEVINAYTSRLPEIKNIVFAGFEEDSLKLVKEQLNGKKTKIISVKEQNAAFKTISKLQPGLVFIDAMMQKGDSISLVDRLKSAFETRDLPVILCLKSDIDKDELALLTAGIERVTIRSKGHRVEILKAIRDRIHLEEGFPGEDTSSILIENRPEEDENMSGENADKLQPNRVLIVDDDAGTLTEVKEIVTNSGCETVVANSGSECLAALRTFKPDLILLDIMMPHMDGFETIKRIKAEKNLKEIPVFALTSHEMIEEKEILIRNGFDDFVSKPVDSGSLSFKIEKVLNIITEC